MRILQPTLRSRSRRGGATPRGAIARALAALALGLVALLPASIAVAQAETHASFSLDHTEEVGEGNYVGYSDGNAGQDGADTIHVTGGLTATHGTHDITIDAAVVPTTDNVARLRTFAEHAYTLTGSDPQSDAWRVGTSSILARAELIDDLTISNTGAQPATIEIYFLVTGESEAVIDLDQPGEVIYDFDTIIRLETETSGSNSGGGTEEHTVSWGGIRYTDLDDRQEVEELVSMSFDLANPTDFHLEMRFELELDTSLTNGLELPTLFTGGHHRATYDDLAAEVVGVVVRDANGDILPNAIIVAIQDKDYPVLDEVPQPPLPDKVILSPVAAATDLGEYDGSVPVSQLIDQSGLFVAFDSGTTGFDAYFAQTDADLANGFYYNNWQSEIAYALPLQGHLEFELDDTYAIDRLALWNVTLEDIRVLVRDSDLAPWSEVGQFTLPDRQAYYSLPVDVLDLGGDHDARSVRIEIDSVHLSSYGPWAYAIVGEVAVSATPAPEPGSAAMLAAGGVGLVLLAGRRRGRKADAAAEGGRD